MNYVEEVQMSETFNKLIIPLYSEVPADRTSEELITQGTFFAEFCNKVDNTVTAVGKISNQVENEVVRCLGKCGIAVWASFGVLQEIFFTAANFPLPSVRFTSITCPKAPDPNTPIAM